MSEAVKLPNDKFQGIARAREYNSRGNMADLGKKLATYIAEHENCKDARVLDFGCGTGLVAIPLLEKCKEIELLDPSEGMLAVLQEELDKQPCKNYRITHGTIFDYKGEDVDIVIAQLVIHHVGDHIGALNEIVKHMKMGARIYVVEFEKTEARNAWSEEQLRDMFDEVGLTGFQYRSWASMRAAFPPSTVETEHPLCMVTAAKE